ncbi:MAG TPA: hypothetical protein VF834_11060 [Streptosporangiaceae bacterium]
MMLASLLALVIGGVAMPAEAGVSHSKPNGNFVVAKNSPKLLAARTITIPGTRTSGNGCTITPPRLRLAPGARATEADEIAFNPSTCASRWHIGVPVTIIRPSGQGYRHLSAVATARASSATARASSAYRIPATQYSTSGYEYAWTTDVINITLTSDKTNIAFAWDYNCVDSASGSANWSWHSSTGWGGPYNNGSWISTNCSYSDVWSQASFNNSVFCWPSTVHSNYSGVYAEGWYDGSLYGWVNNMSYSGSCLPLYLHSQLVRVSG